MPEERRCQSCSALSLSPSLTRSKWRYIPPVTFLFVCPSFITFLRAFLWSFFRGLNPVAIPHSWYFGGSSFQWSRVWTCWAQTHVFARRVVLAHVIDFGQAACLHIGAICGTCRSFTLGSFRTLLCNSTALCANDDDLSSCLCFPHHVTAAKGAYPVGLQREPTNLTSKR